MARLLLGVTGGIAAYKALELTRLATKAGHAVRVVQTEASTRFVGSASFAGITGAPVLITEWEPDPLRGAFPGDPAPAHAPLSHLRARRRPPTSYAIAPASANTIAKLAAGAADNLLTAIALAFRGPLLVAPAMNHAMYEHPATQANLAMLRERGATVLEPGTGALGSPGEWGIGRLPEPPALLAAIEAALAPAPRDLDGLSVLVTAGGTREPIDAVRFIGNRSSGPDGLRARGARPPAAAPTSPSSPPTSRSRATPRVPLRRRRDHRRARRGLQQPSLEPADVLLMAAAVADYRPAAAHAGKIKKADAGAELALALERTEDVLAGLAGAPPQRAGDRRLRRRGGRGGASPTAAASSRASSSTRSSSTTSPSRGSASTPATTRSRSSPAIRSATSRVPRRRRSRPRSSTPS